VFTMTHLFLYILGASCDPDFVKCDVPLEINERKIFFGPCSKNLRNYLKREFLKENNHVNINDKEVFIVGFNALNYKRKIVWSGKVTDIMTYEEAYNSLSKNKDFSELFNFDSPLHLKPIYERDKFTGYEHITSKHEEDWVWDVINKRKKKISKKYSVDGSTVKLNSGAHRNDVFSLDCCFICENIFYAKGLGLEINDKLINILKKAQPEKEGIDKQNIFGLNSKSKTDGRRGNPLLIKDKVAECFIAELDRIIKI